MFRKALYGFFLIPAQLLLCSLAFGQSVLDLYLGAGEPGSESFVLGVGVTSLVKVKLLPNDGIDLTLVELGNRDIAADLSIIDQEKVANLVGWEPATRRQRADLRSIMTFNRVDVESGPSLELITRADVSDRGIYFITKAILENGVFFEGLNQRSWDLSADKALVGLTLPLHPGAARYYEEIGEANLSAHLAHDDTLPEAEARQGASTFLLDFGADATTLDQDARRRIAEACQYATIFDATKIEVASYADMSDGDSSLADARERYVVEALRSNAGCGENVEIVSADRTLSTLASTAGPPVSGGTDLVEVVIKFTN